MSTAVIYDSSFPWIPPHSSTPSSAASFQRSTSTHPLEIDGQRSHIALPMHDLVRGPQGRCVSPYAPPFNALVNGVDNLQLFYVDNMSPALFSGSGDLSMTHSPPSSPGSALVSRTRSAPSRQVVSGSSRSARMRSALRVLAQDSSPAAAIPHPSRQIKTVAGHSPLPGPARLQTGQAEVIAEFGPQEIYHSPTPDTARFESVKNSSVLANPAVPPRMQSSLTTGPRTRSKAWRSTPEDLPPRFRGNHSYVPQNPGPAKSVWVQPQQSKQDNYPSNLAISFHPHLSQPHHLSSFLMNDVSHASRIPRDTRSPQEHDPKLYCQERTLAPIGAERAQRLASTANVMPLNLYYNANNPKSHSFSQNPIDLPGLSGPLSPQFLFSSNDPRLQRHADPNAHVDRFSHSEFTKGVTCHQGQTELEQLFNRTKTNKYAPKVASPLSPLRNPDVLSASDVKWRRQERDQRRKHIFLSCETSVFRRKTSDRRSRGECEEFADGVEISEHCYSCRQDTLCKRLLIHRARDVIRSNSSSPVSEYSTSSEEGIDDDEPIFVTPVDPSRLGKPSAVGKVTGFDAITVVDVENIDPDHSPASSVLVM